MRELRDCLRPREVMHYRDLAVDGLAFHSSEVRPGNLFFAIRGMRADGAVYAQQAVARGAAAVVAEQALPVSVPLLVVDNARAALFARQLADMIECAAKFEGSGALKHLGLDQEAAAQAGVQQR